MHCGVEVTESSTNKQHNLSDLGLTDAADVGYFRSPGLAYASEFLDPAVFLASFFEPLGSLAICSMRMVLSISRTVLVICQILDFLTRRSPWLDL